MPDVSLSLQNGVFEPTLLALVALSAVWRVCHWHTTKPALQAALLDPDGESASDKLLASRATAAAALAPPAVSQTAKIGSTIAEFMSLLLVGVNGALLCSLPGDAEGGIASTGNDGEHAVLGAACATASWVISTAVLLLERTRGLRVCRSLRLWWLLAFVVSVIRFRTDLIQAKNGDRGSLHVVAFVPHLVLGIIAILSPDTLTNEGYHMDGNALPTPSERWLAERAAAETGGADDDDLSSRALFRRNPEATASFFERITFWWLNGTMRRGAAAGHFLEVDDLHQLQSLDCTSRSYATLARAWGRERPSFFYALARAFGPYFACTGLYKLLNDIVVFINPMLISALVNFIENSESNPGESKMTGYGYAAAMLAAATVESLAMGQYFFRGYRLGYRVRSSIAQAVFSKAMRLTFESRRSFGVGAIVSYMQIDSDKIANAVPYLHLAWSAPLQLAIALYLLQAQVGPSAFAGLGILIALMPVNTWVAKKQMAYTKSVMEARDKRVKLMNEIVQGVRVVKLCAWEQPLQERLRQLREVELGEIRANSLLGAFSTFLWGATPLFVTVCTFALFAALNGAKALTAGKAFTSLALFNLLRFPLNAIPMTISRIVDLKVVVGRLGRYLDADELSDTELITHADADPNSDGYRRDSNAGTAEAIRVSDITVTWPDADAETAAAAAKNGKAKAKDKAAGDEGDATKKTTVVPPPPELEQRPTLQDLNITVSRGELLGVTGPVGSGKSSFLSALVNEIPRVSGAISISGSLAYCGQVPWIQNRSLRDNILFMRPFDASRYETTLRVCALHDDLEQLAAGDSTEIGERGINLSGGQKARVALARAVYADADVYVMDDVLSAVDATVCEHLMQQCIGVGRHCAASATASSSAGTATAAAGAALRNKTRVLATHHRQWLQRCDKVLVLNEDRTVAAFGPPTAANVSVHLGDVLSSPKKPSQKKNIKDVEDSSVQGAQKAGAQDSKSVPKNGAKTDVGKSSKDAGKLVQQEDRSKGHVAAKIWSTYSRAFGVRPIMLLVFLYSIAQALQVGSSGWLNVWSSDAKKSDAKSTTYYIGIYSALALTSALFILLRAVTVALAVVRAGRQTHERALRGLLAAPVRFFDETPIGRILNRFSNDQRTVDVQLRFTTQQLFLCVFSMLGVLGVICYATPYVAACLVPMAWVYNRVAYYYRCSSRELQRLDSISKSPVYESFSEALSGVTTIRAFGTEMSARFEATNAAMVDKNMRCAFISQTANRWLAIRLEFIGNTLIGLTAFFIVLETGSSSGLSAGIAGLTLSYVINFTGYLNWLVRVFTTCETQMVNVERLHHYGALDPEEESAETRASRNAAPTQAPPPEWPHEGAIELKDVWLRYSETGDDVLRGITFTVKAGEKVGIMGRTGAGKSSLIAALFRMVTPNLRRGTITIDGIDTDSVTLHDLRSRLAVIPQDPVLFSGTMRSNIDPFDDRSDDELWRVLDTCQLGDFVRAAGSDAGLGMVIEGGGSNLSVGQRQLVCLARALLRRARIVVLDEATAAIDHEHDTAIQCALREQTQNCSLLTVAHRLETIVDYDSVVVLEAGRVRKVLRKPMSVSQLRQELGH